MMRRKMEMRTRPTSGFTLIEVLLVVAILGILATIAVVGIGGHLDKANITATRGNIDAIQKAIEIDPNYLEARLNLGSILLEYLDETGYEIDSAVNGQQAWEKLEADPGRYDVVLLDRMMPGLSGMQVLERINSVLEMEPSIVLSEFDDSVISHIDYPDWFKKTFYDLDEDIAEGRDDGKQGLMILFTTQGCSYCARFIDVSLGNPELAARVRATSTPVT